MLHYIRGSRLQKCGGYSHLPYSPRHTPISQEVVLVLVRFPLKPDRVDLGSRPIKYASVKQGTGKVEMAVELAGGEHTKTNRIKATANLAR